MHEIQMMIKMKSTILSIMNPRVTELKPPIENQEFFIVDRYLVSIYQRREMKRDDLTYRWIRFAFKYCFFGLVCLSMWKILNKKQIKSVLNSIFLFMIRPNQCWTSFKLIHFYEYIFVIRYFQKSSDEFDVLRGLIIKNSSY